MKAMGQHIRDLREQKDISLRELAKRLDVSAAFMSDVELGRRFPSREILTKIAKALGVTAEELEAFDTRPPIEDLKRYAASDPAYGFAFRRIVDKASTQDLMKFVKQLEQKKKKQK